MNPGCYSLLARSFLLMGHGLHSHHFGRAFLCASFFFCLPGLLLAATGGIQGQVTAMGVGVPIEGARLTFDFEPTNGVPEYTAESSPFGFYRLDGVTTGTYRLRAEHPGYSPHEETVIIGENNTLNRNIALTPLGGVRFDIFVQASDVTSGLQLSGVPVVIERYATALDAVPLESRDLTTDSNGFGVLRGMQSGHYRFVANSGGGARPKWEAFTNVPTAGSKPLLSKAHMANLLLKPIPQDLHVRVTGFNPITRLSNVPLNGFFVELAGVDPANTNRVIVPPRTGVTEINGQVQFSKLPAVAWRIRAKKLGYAQAEQIIFPNGSGDFVPGNTAGNPVVLNAAITPTHLYVDTTHPYTITSLFDFLSMRIEGLTNTTAEGVALTASSYNVPGLRDDRNFTGILPGRYRVTMNAQPQFGLQGIRPHFQAGDYVDVPPGIPAKGGYTDLILPLTVVPASVRGRLFVADESGSIVPGAAVVSGLPPRYLPRAGVAVEIIEFSTDQLLKPAFRTNIVTTDANGEFTASVLPARYGLRIAALTGYNGGQIRLRNFTTTVPAEKDITQIWPYAEPWPWFAGQSGDPLKFHSGHDYRLDMFVEKQVAVVRGQVTQSGGVESDLVSGNPSGTATLLTSPGGAVVQTVELTGSQNQFVFRDVPAGDYTYSVAHPRFSVSYNGNPTPDPVSFSFIGNAPGVVPPTDPLALDLATPFQFVPAPSAQASVLVGTAELIFNRHRWSGSAYDTNVFPNHPFVVRILPDYAGGNVASGTTIPPEGGFKFWARIATGTGFVNHSNYVSQATGQHTIDIYFGTDGDHGPLGNVQSGIPPEPFDWSILFVNDADPTQLVTDPTSFTITDGTDYPLTASGSFFTNWAGSRTITLVDNSSWVLSTIETVITNYTTPTYRTLVRMRRGTTFQGTVTNNTANTPVAGAKIQLKNRFGAVVRDGLTDANGNFTFAGELSDAAPVFLDITAPGFKPFRSRHTADEAVPDPGDPSKSSLTLNARMDPIFPSPSIQEVTMDRQGLFLPGVRLAGNQSLLDAFQAIGPLTMTWIVRAKSDPVSASLVPFDTPNGAAGGSQNLVIEDPVQEIWLVDPRGYTNSAYTGTPIPLPPPPVNQGYPALHLWLQNIVTNQITNVFYLRVTNLTDTAQLGQVTTTNTVSIWKLPPGDFKPIFVAVTQRGAVTVTNLFEQPETPAQLSGIGLPRWLAFAADIMGGVAGVSATQEKVKEWIPDGKFLPLPVFTADIDADESGFLLYNYLMDIAWSESTETPGDGLLALAPGRLGLEFNGQLNFGLNGADTNLFLNANADFHVEDVSLTPLIPKAVLLAALETNSLPGETPGGFEFEESRIDVDASTLGRKNFAPLTQPYEFEMTNSIGGSYSAAVKANLTPVVSKLPYVGPMLLALDKSGAFTVSGVMDAAIGLKATNVWHTTFPPSVESGSSSDPVKHTLRRQFLGGTEVENQLALCFRFGAGLDLDAFSGRARARGKLNLAGNQCSLGSGESPKPATLLDINPNFDWPLIQRISGNVTATLDASLDVWIAQVGKSWEWELFAFEHSFNTDPFFELIPMNITATVLTPATATASTFNAAGPVIISNLYPAAVFAASQGSGEALAFTDIDAGTGNMLLKVAIRSGANPFALPVTVASAAGILATDVAALPDGGWMIVWTQLAPGDVSNPFPPSTIMSATSADGVNWSAPMQIVSLADVANDLQLVTSSNLVGLAYLHTAEGPEASNYSLDVTRWTGTGWTAPVNLLSSAAIRGFVAEGAGATSAQPAVIALALSDAQLNAFTWDGTTITGPAIVTNSAAETLALATDGSGRFFLGWEPLGGGIGLFDFDTTNGWSNLGKPISAAFPTELRLTPLTNADGLTLLLSWVEGGDVTSIWTAFVDANGTLLKAPSNLTLNTAGRFRDLQVLPRADRTAKIIARFEDGRHDVIEFTASFNAANALLDSPRRLSDGTFEFSFSGNPNQIYRIEASTNLAQWQTVTNVTAQTNSIFILDPGAKTLPWRFYRAVSP